MTRVTAPFDRVLKRIREEINDPKPNEAVVKALIDIGFAALVRAAESKETGNITLNQMEAFACAVYFGGERQRTKFLEGDMYRGNHINKEGRDVIGAEKDSKRGRMGRSMALHAVRDHKPLTMGYELYITNAMWYSAIHENGWKMRNGEQHRPLRIITQEILDTVGQIEQLFGVDVYVDVWSNGTKK